MTSQCHAMINGMALMKIALHQQTSKYETYSNHHGLYNVPGRFCPPTKQTVKQAVNNLNQTKWKISPYRQSMNF